MVETDDRWMARAVRLAKKGFPAPNPRVGCVIVRDGELVGEGHHDYAGGPHAEAVALGRAGSRAKGSTVYVTLEPCRHHGRTPPCTDALIQAGVRRVVVANPDPNPVAAGGSAVLREAGIDVVAGVGLSLAEEVNRVFLTAHRLKRAYVSLKAATSLDGFMAPETGASGRITGEAARREGRRLRAEMGAVLVGRGTVEADDPQLTARYKGVVNEPVRLVLDSNRKLSGSERVWQSPGRAVRIVELGQGVGGDWEIETQDGRFDLYQVAQIAFREGLTGVLVEGGPRTLTSFLRAGLGDALEWFTSPNVLGSGRRFDLGQWRGGAWSWRAAKRVGTDVWLRAVQANMPRA